MDENTDNRQTLHEAFELKNPDRRIDKTISRRDFAEKFISDYLVCCNNQDLERINDLMRLGGLEIEFTRYYYPDDMNYNLDEILKLLKKVAPNNENIKPIFSNQNLATDINKPLAQNKESVINYRNFLKYLYNLVRELEFVKSGVLPNIDLTFENQFIIKHLSAQFNDDNNNKLLMFFLRDLIKGRALHFFEFDLEKFETAEYYIEIDKHSTFIYKKGDSKIRLNQKYSKDIHPLIINDNYISGCSADNSVIYESILTQAKKIISKYNSDEIKDETKCTICKKDITRSVEKTKNKKSCIRCQDFLNEMAIVNELYNNKCKPLRLRSTDKENILSSFRAKKTRSESLKYCKDLLKEVENMPESEQLSKMFHEIFPETKK